MPTDSFPVHIKDMTLSSLEHFFEEIGEEKYRARQVARWVFKKGARSFDEMTDLPKDLRDRLSGFMEIGSLNILEKKVSRRKGAVKYLFGLSDGQAVEAVFLRYSYGNAVCVSTQVGCRMGCAFCASGIGGFVRNLRPGEIYDQVLGVQRDTCQRITHVVLMGSGEPLDNYSSTLTFIRNVIAPYALNLSPRRITVSTCGMVPQIRRLAGEDLAVTLAVSLHAPDDYLRNALVPINKKYPIGELIAACHHYYHITGRRVTFEYALISGVNDSRQHAEKLGRLLNGFPCHVNLIPANPVPEKGVEGVPRQKAEHFKRVVESHGLPVTIRRELGTDIDAACGQLRRRAAYGQKGRL